MSKPLLQLSEIGKFYGASVAATDINLSVAAGEFLTFLGPSGSGKTTTLMMVAGFTEPTAGHIHLEGEPLDPIPVYKRDIGMVFQHYALFPHLTVNQNVGFPLEMRKVAKADRHSRVAEALDMVGLSGFGERQPKELSGGQQQRVALARAMVFKPRLLLMDEPLGALDKKLREHMQLEIMHLHQNLGTTVLYVTHDQEEALVMSDRIAVFNHGRIEQVGSPQELYEAPASKFVADFIGETNFISGKVESADGETGIVKGLTGRRSAGLAAGEAAVLAIRPERVKLLKQREQSGFNIVSGTVKELIYLGQSRKIVVQSEAGDEIVALQQAADAEVSPMHVGHTTHLGFRPEDTRILADV